jgi:hypothetical protein
MSDTSRKRFHAASYARLKSKRSSPAMIQDAIEDQPALSGHLNVGRMGRAVIAEHDRQTHHALAANQPDSSAHP